MVGNTERERHSANDRTPAESASESVRLELAILGGETEAGLTPEPDASRPAPHRGADSQGAVSNHPLDAGPKVGHGVP